MYPIYAVRGTKPESSNTNSTWKICVSTCAGKLRGRLLVIQPLAMNRFDEPLGRHFVDPSQSGNPGSLGHDEIGVPLFDRNKQIEQQVSDDEERAVDQSPIPRPVGEIERAEDETQSQRRGMVERQPASRPPSSTPKTAPRSCATGCGSGARTVRTTSRT